MNPNSPHGFYFSRRVGGQATALEQGWTVPGATLFRAAPLVRENGLIRQATKADRKILGVAAEGVTGVEGISQEVLFIPALPDTIFSGQVSGCVSMEVLDKRMGISGEGGSMVLDPSGENEVAQIIGIKDGSEWGEHSELYFIFCKSQFCGSY